MPSRPAAFRPLHKHASETGAKTDNRGGPRSRGYDSTWDKASKAYRRAFPACQYCEVAAFGEQRDEPSTRVDHLYPQRRFPGVFWVEAWWVASCDACDAGKQALEHGSRLGLDDLARRLGRPVMAG